MTITRKDLKVIRLVHGMNQSQIGAILGVHQSAVAQMENGHINISQEHQAKIVDHFKLTPGRLSLLRGVFMEFNSKAAVI